MSGTRPPGTYRTVWQIPGAPNLLVAGTLARLGQGVTVLAWLLLVRATTGSYTQAALVTATTSVAIAVAAPVAGRLTDRHGPTRVLPVYAVAHACTQLLLLVAVLSGAPLVLLCVLGLITGAAFPPVGAALRTAWARLTTGRAQSRTAALAIDSALFELVFVLGPLLLAGAVLVAGQLSGLAGPTDVLGPATAIAAAALCTLVGATAVARGVAMRSAPPAEPHDRTRGLGPLRIPGIRMMLVATVGIAISFGAAPVAIAAYSESRDGAAAGAVAGVLIAVWSLGSAAAGLWFGSRTWRTPVDRQFVLLTTALAAGYVLWLAAPTSWWLGAVLLVTGAVIAPLLTVQAALVARLTPRAMLTEAYTWLTTTNLAAAALGSAVTGWVLDLTGSAGWGFTVAAVGTAGAVVVAAWPGALSPRRDPEVTPASPVAAVAPVAVAP
jgi:MFS family permease